MPSATALAEQDRSVFQVRRPDTLQFSSIEGLCRMAGVPRDKLRALIAKELVDNGLDETDRTGRPGQVSVERVGGDLYRVTDQGGGIPGDAATLADLFSSGRAMLSGKALRLPRRGLLGNGLRCLVAAVALAGGDIVVECRGVRTRLRPRRVGETQIVDVAASSRTAGTLLQYTLGEVIPPDSRDLEDAEAAIALARAAGPTYSRRPSPHWLDADHLFETFATIEPVDLTVRQVVERLDGCSGAMAGKLAAPFGKGRTCRGMTEPEVAGLLTAMQKVARAVKPRSLGPVGPAAFGDRYDGYAVVEGWLRVGAHEPCGLVPVLIEAWADVTTRRGGDASLQIFCNRSPAVGGAEAVRAAAGGGLRLAGAGLSRWGDVVRVEGGDCHLVVAVTAPLIPTTSLGKAPDLSPLQGGVAEALRRAFNRSRNRLPPDPAQPKPPRAEPPPKPAKPPPFEPSGPLATLLAREADGAGVLPRDLLVLSPKHDPFAETQASRREAEWFAEQIARFLPTGKIHLRGLYYRCLSAGDVRLPDGKRFVGTNRTAELVADAGKYARHLGLVAFDRIIDERAAPPEFYDAEGGAADPCDTRHERWLIVAGGGNAVAMPPLSALLPTIGASDVPRPRQPYRICVIGEKVSLADVLRPIAREVEGELLLATGEVSEAAAHGIAARAASDGRPLRVLYFSDFDPSGWQMPVSVARKLQAHRCREFPGLDVRVIRVALNYEQVVAFNLPDSPIKPGERRARQWRARWGREQVEVDALAALRPDILDRIARAAVAPYFDPTFDPRFAAATEPPANLQLWFSRQPAYTAAVRLIRSAHGPAGKAVTALNEASRGAIAALRKAIEVAEGKPDLPPVEVHPEIAAAEPDDAVFDSRDDFVTATRRLKAIKALSPDPDDEADGAEASEQ